MRFVSAKTFGFATAFIAAILVTIYFSKGRVVNSGSVVANFSLFDSQDGYFELHRQSKAKAIVLIAHGIGCPVLAKNMPVIKELNEKFGGEGVRFFFINANGHDSAPDINEDIKKFDVHIPVLIDRSQTIMASLNMTRQGEAVVIDTSTWKSVYRGQIDDRLDYGIEKPQAKNDYLIRAIDGVLLGRKIETPFTETVGCAISFEKTPDPVTYFDHIQPLIQKKCANCHYKNGAPPENFATYQDVRGWSAMIKEVVRTNRMPPWELSPNAENISLNRTLSNEEVRLLMKWIDTDMAKGHARSFNESSSVTRKNFVVAKTWKGPQNIAIEPRMKKPWNYTVLEANQAQDEWYDAVEFSLSTPRLLQHIELLVLSKCLDPEDHEYEPQYRMKDGNILGMIKAEPLSTKPVSFPEGVAVKIPRGSCVVLEQHFSPTGKAENYSALVRLRKYVGVKPPREYLYQAVAISNFEIPPLAENFEVEAFQTFEKDFYVYRFAVHMHKRGQAMRLDAVLADGKIEPLFSVPHYMFQHRLSYTLEKPVLVKAGTVLRATAVYDNSAANPYNPDPSKLVKFDPDIDKGEMMIMHLFGYH